ncbi:hypothetical protein PHET_02193 [Paragonimus heterotremus]|uniref:Uncharacterized protein n=1 Tax=Paragonimus heterotremus TaxID=100268 RepID=A0A8J4SSM2_9TREM|nr:hypothetical protein PHET_02193 [Paragonimus heterotremus]
MKKIDNRFGVEKVDDPVDICDLIIRYATEFPLPREIKSRVNMDDLKSSDLDMSRLRIVNKPTCHIANSEGTTGLPNGLPNDDAGLTSSIDKHRKGVKSHILFSSEFTNNTTETQTNHLRTERRTCSSCRISMHKSVTKEGNFTLQISPPGSVIQANGGFRREIHMDKEREKVFEEELVWSLDTEVVVPPGYRTRAELVITEDEYDGRFCVETVFEGTVSIRLRDKRDGSMIYPLVINDLTQVLTPEHGFHPIPKQPGAVGFTNEGHCHCHFGIGQQVALQQMKL